MKPEVLTFTREALYERIWTEPMTKLSAQLGISDVALAKTCRKLNIPRPSRGHWARIAAGQDSPRPALPAADSRTPKVARFDVWPAPPAPDEATQAAIDREDLLQFRIEVSGSLTEPHPFVRQSKDALRKAKPAADGRIERRDIQCLSLHVSPELLDRSLRIMDALLKALGARDLTVEVTKPEPVRIWKPGVTVEAVTMPLTRVIVDGELIPICLEELVDVTDLSKVDPDKYHREQYSRRPNGRLQLRVFSELADYPGCSAPKTNWTDGKKGQLEQMLNAFVATLYLVSMNIKRSRAESELRRIEQEKEAKHFEEMARAHELETERRQRIGDVIRNWTLARDIRALVADAHRIAETGQCEIDPTGNFGNWLQWCESYADSVDPLSPLREAVASHESHPEAETNIDKTCREE